jgi:ferritin-like metal-binding protein YciE
MKEKQEQLVKWLTEAYATDQGIMETLKRHLKDAEDYPDVAVKINEHIEEAEEESEKIKECIERLGGDVSKSKEILAKTGGMFAGLSNIMSDDKVLKNAIAQYGIEYMEIATYKSIGEVAKELGDMETANVCSEIVTGEQDMADWLEEQILVLATDYISEMKEEEDETGTDDDDEEE